MGVTWGGPPGNESAFATVARAIKSVIRKVRVALSRK